MERSWRRQVTPRAVPPHAKVARRPDGHQATFGLWLGPDARGRGIGTRALRRVADWTFETTAAIRLDAFIMVGNEPSHRMVERVGFQREGVLRGWDLHHDGVPVDCVVYSRLRTD